MIRNSEDIKKEIEFHQDIVDDWGKKKSSYDSIIRGSLGNAVEQSKVHLYHLNKELEYAQEIQKKDDKYFLEIQDVEQIVHVEKLKFNDLEHNAEQVHNIWACWMKYFITNCIYVSSTGDSCIEEKMN